MWGLFFPQDSKTYFDEGFKELAFSFVEHENLFNQITLTIFNMLNLRKIDLIELKSLFFIERDILLDPDAKKNRYQKLVRAMTLSNMEHQTTGMTLALLNGELVQTFSDFVDCTDDHVQLRGGVTIPIRAIVDVDL